MLGPQSLRLTEKNMRGIPIAVPLVAILFAGCGGPAEVSPAEVNEAQSAPAVMAVEVALVYDVECGCTIEAIGHCGNYLKHDDKFLEITGVGLGPMEFCEKEGLKAKIAGEVVDGKFAATSFDYVTKQ